MQTANFSLWMKAYTSLRDELDGGFDKDITHALCCLRSNAVINSLLKCVRWYCEVAKNATALRSCCY